MDDDGQMHTRPLGAAPLFLLSFALVVSACTGSGSATPSAKTGAPGVSAAPPSAAAPSGSAGSQPAAPGSGSQAPSIVLDQAWATVPLVDATTGESFRIADHAGKVIFIETMAIWCGNCLRQQVDVQSALARLPADRVVYVVLDVDPNEDAASLAAYREQHGFQGRYAIANTEVARALAAEFGDQFLNPPSTPMLVVGADGTVTRTEFGPKTADSIVALAKAHGA